MDDQHDFGSGANAPRDPRKRDTDDDDSDWVETPLDTNDLSLNPGYPQAPRNPLCPVCNSEIRPISNEHERRFVCDCEQIWQFRFEPQE